MRDGRGTKNTVLGVEYPSIPAAWRAHKPEGVSCHLAQARVRLMGWTVEKAVTTPKRGMRVVVHGMHYLTLKEAWENHGPEGLLLDAVRDRVDRGWEPWRAVLVGPQPNSLYMRAKNEKG